MRFILGSVVADLSRLDGYVQADQLRVLRQLARHRNVGRRASLLPLHPAQHASSDQSKNKITIFRFMPVIVFCLMERAYTICRAANEVFMCGDNLSLDHLILLSSVEYIVAKSAF